MRNQRTKQPQAKQPQKQEQPADMLDQELEDSFPASDPPQTTQPHARTGTPHRPAASTRSKGKSPRPRVII